MVKQPLTTAPDYFLMYDPQKYWEITFYSYLANCNLVSSFSSPYEKELYEKSVERMMKFCKAKDFYDALDDFSWNVKTAQHTLEANTVNNNILSRKTEIDDVFKNDLREIVERYSGLVNGL